MKTNDLIASIISLALIMHGRYCWKKSNMLSFYKILMEKKRKAEIKGEKMDVIIPKNTPIQPQR